MNHDKMKLHLTLPLPVSLNQLYINEYRYNPVSKKREATGKRILSDKGFTSKKLIQKATLKQLKKQQWDYEFTKTNFIYLDTYIYFNKMGRDDNNIYKLLCDSLEKIVYDNDSRIYVRTQRIFYDTVNPKVDLVLHPVPFIGIFDDKEELKEFETICQTCSRYRNGRCSLLVKAQEGRIQPEIEGQECKEYKEKKK